MKIESRPPVEAVLFDFGGVFLDLDYPATERALRALIGDSAHYSKQAQSPVFDAFETGAISADEFRAEIRGWASTELSDRAIDSAWNAMLLGVHRLERFAFLRTIARYRRCFLFSNTNPIHKACFDPMLAKHLGPGGFDRLFEATYYSHVFGMRKPDPESYRKILGIHGLKPERTLFIDDSLANVEGAAKAGLQALHLQGELLDDERLHFLLQAIPAPLS